MNLCNDIINEIMTYLHPIDIYHLKSSCLFFYNLDMKKYIIDKINERLFEIFGDRLSDFKQCLKNTGAVISGSFLLQCVLNERWEGSDIDIYVPIIGNNISRIEGGYIKSALDDFMHYEMKLDGSHDNYAEEINNNIKWVRNYRKHFNDQSSTTIQIIGLYIDKNIESLQYEIDQMFDFDLCKNIYYYNGRDNIILSNLYDICNKMTHFKSSRLLRSSLERYHKYKRRGFTFKNKNTLCYDDIKSFDNPLLLVVAEDCKSDISKILSFFKYHDPIICDKIKGKIIWCHHDILKMNKQFGEKLICGHTYNNKIPLINECGDHCIIKFCNDTIKHHHNTSYSDIVNDVSSINEILIE